MEKKFQILSRELNVPVSIVRPFNIYGERYKWVGEYSQAIPMIVKKILDGNNPVEIWGSGKPRREFMYASDLADFIYYSIKHFDKMPQNINVGIGTDYNINEYYKIIADVIGFKGKFKNDLSKPTGMKRKLIDNKKLKKFGWSHKTSLESGIKQTYEYFLDKIQK